MTEVQKYKEAASRGNSVAVFSWMPCFLSCLIYFFSCLICRCVCTHKCHVLFNASCPSLFLFPPLSLLLHHEAIWMPYSLGCLISLKKTSFLCVPLDFYLFAKASFLRVPLDFYMFARGLFCHVCALLHTHDKYVCVCVSVGMCVYILSGKTCVCQMTLLSCVFHVTFWS